MEKLVLGQTVMTRGVNQFILEKDIQPQELYKIVQRHESGDWGDVPKEDKKLNDWALKHGDGRILSSYKLGGEKVWIITEADRSYTTVLFPDEY